MIFITRLITGILVGVNKILIIITVLLLNFSFAQVSAQTYYYQSGTLSTPANWNTARNGSGTALNNFTTSNRTYVIQNGQTVTNSSAWSISGNNSKLQIENGASLTATTAINLSANTTFQIDNGGTYIHNNTSSLSTTIFQGTESFGVNSTFQVNNWQSAGTSITSNVTASAAPGDGNTYYYGNLIINWAGGANWNQGWGSTNIYLSAGNFTIASAFTGTFLFTASNAQPYVYIYGNYTLQAPGGIMNFNSNNATNYPRIYVNGNINHTAGTITTTGSNAYGSIYTYGSLISSWSFSGGTRNYLSYVISSGKTVNLATSFNLNNLPTALDDLTINGILNAGNFIINYGATTSYANVIISSTGTITTTNLNGLAGSALTTINPFNPNPVHTYLMTGSTIEYKATSGTQVITTPSNANYLYDATSSNLPNYENLTINGSGIKQLSTALTISKMLTLSSGKLDIQNFILTIETAGSISGANSTNYIITGNNAGRLRQNGLSAATARLFPVGTSSCYLPVTLTPATASSSYSVNVFTGATTNGTAGGTAWTATQKKGMVDAVWNVDRNSGSGNDAVNLQWDNCNASLEGTDFVSASNTNIGIWRLVSGTNWSTAASNFTANNSNAGGFNTAANTSSPTFNGPYIVAVLNSPLANNNLKVDAALLNNDVVLNWSLQNPTDIKDFEVERSYDKVNFIKTGSVKSNLQNNYSYVDKNPPGSLIYYRLVLNTWTGTYSYSPTVSIIKKMTEKLKLINNPVVDKLIFYQKSSLNTQYRIINTDGKLLMKGNIAPHSEITTLNIQSLSAGIYLLQLIDGTEVTTERFIKH